jgi:6-phosphogluconolactonase (cycloisomerase 2 family)
MTKVPFAPFGVSATPGGRWDLVGALAARSSVAVFANRAAGGPRLVRQIRLPQAALGTHLTADGRYLLAADDGGGADVVAISRAVRGKKGALLGALNAPGGGGAIEVTTSLDGRFAFVSLEDSAAIAVFNLRRALSKGFTRADFVGLIPVGIAPVGMTVSPNGRWLYATSELSSKARARYGTLSVINVKTAESRPDKSVVTSVDAGCGPVRVITSGSGSTVWVTARESNSLLGFSAARLISAPKRALVAVVRVGQAPVGLALVNRGSAIVVADSNRFRIAGAKSSLAVVSVAHALAGRGALVGYLPAGLFPREMTVVPNRRTLLVGNFASDQLESVDLARLP